MGTAKLVVFGGGNMGAALVGGLLRAGWAEAAELAIVEPVAARRDELGQRFPGVAVGAAPPASGDAVLLAVKPVDIADAGAAAGALGAARVLSIAAGVPTATLEAALPAGTRVVRAMPNTPALVGAGASAIAPGAAADDDDLAWAETILSSVGTVVRVPEHLLDAVTGLSGSGPAYVFLVAEALVDAGVAAGLPRATSSALVEQLLVGSARLLVESGQHPAELRAQVTSPGGTTAAGVHELEKAGVRAALIDSVLAATARSRELGR
jgi:pyrroline-5-carboxylate reductase